MYGKTFESMYHGSLVGAGFHVWAVWNYIITNTHYSTIELNPALLAFTLEKDNPKAEKMVEQAIEFLCQADPKSRSKEEGGRRLIREGQFQYRVVNWEKYQSIKSAESLRAYNRNKQAEYRAKKKAYRDATPAEKAEIDRARAKSIEANKVAYKAIKEWNEAEAQLEEPPMQEPDGL